MKTYGILPAALDCARDLGYRTMTRRDVAEYANCAESLISHILGDMEQVRTEVMRYAVQMKDPIVVAQGVFFQHPLALKADDSLKQAAVDLIVVRGGLK